MRRYETSQKVGEKIRTSGGHILTRSDDDLGSMDSPPSVIKRNDNTGGSSQKKSFKPSRSMLRSSGRANRTRKLGYLLHEAIAILRQELRRYSHL